MASCSARILGRSAINVEEETVSGPQPHDDAERDATPLVPPDLLEILRCPAADCRQRLEEQRSARRLICAGCDRRYAVSEQGIPNLLLEDAEGGPS
jgi:uncharacterized protein YbaR (Trm112 family)